MARLLSRGMTGLDVKELQAALNFHVRSPAVPLVPDGIFGPLTEARVRDFQRLAELAPDALVGPNTVAALYRHVRGVVEAQLTPRSAATRAGGRPLAGFRPVVRQLAPGDPGVALPQARTAASAGFDVETKLTFNPFAKPSQGDQPLQLTLSKSIPWPVFLPEPLVLDIGLGTGDKFELGGKLKLPFKLIKTDRLELKPYFFVGGGVEQTHFKDLNLGGGAKLTLKLFKDIGGTGISVGLEADGGLKYSHDLDKGVGKLKGYGEGTVVITIPLFFF